MGDALDDGKELGSFPAASQPGKGHEWLNLCLWIVRVVGWEGHVLGRSKTGSQCGQVTPLQVRGSGEGLG